MNLPFSTRQDISKEVVSSDMEHLSLNAGQKCIASLLHVKHREHQHSTSNRHGPSSCATGTLSLDKSTPDQPQLAVEARDTTSFSAVLEQRLSMGKLGS